MASEYTYVNNAKTEVKNIYVNSGKDLVKVVRVNNGKNVVHRASYEITHTAGTGLTVVQVSPRVGKHGLTLTYDITADHVDRLDTATTSWGGGVLLQPEGPTTAEWTFETPAITGPGSVTFSSENAYVSVPALSSNPAGFTVTSGGNITLTATSYANLGSSITYQWEKSDDDGETWTAAGSQQNLTLTNVTQGYWYYSARAYHVSGQIYSAWSDGVRVNVSSAPPASASFTVQRLTYTEGQSQVWSFNYANVTTMYWRIIGTGTNPAASADFTSSSGSFTPSGGSGTITIATVADSTTEGNQTFQVQLSNTSNFSNILATSSVATIQDTSTTPASMTVDISPSVSTWGEGNLIASYTHNFSSTVYSAPGSVTYSWSVTNMSHSSSTSWGSTTGSSFSVTTSGSGASRTVSFTVNLTVTSSGQTANDSSTGSTIYGIIE